MVFYRDAHVQHIVSRMEWKQGRKKREQQVSTRLVQYGTDSSPMAVRKEQWYGMVWCGDEGAWVGGKFIQPHRAESQVMSLACKTWVALGPGGFSSAGLPCSRVSRPQTAPEAT